jgi:hypothetical protein
MTELFKNIKEDDRSKIMIKKLSSSAKSIEVGLQKKVDEMHKSELFLRSKGKLGFLIGVFGCMFTPYVMAGFPEWFGVFYTMATIFLVCVRLVRYKKRNWHYFLLDFCYYANGAVMVYYWFMPDNALLFMVCYAMSTGPVAMAIIVWKLPLIFHSIDKVTGVFIHIFPALLMYILRWKSHVYPNHKICDDEECYLGYFDSLWYPVIFYIIWQFFYYIRVEVVAAAKDRMRSFKYLYEQKGTIYRLIIKPFGIEKDRAIHGFILIQFAFTFVSLLPVKIFWDNESLNLAWIVIIMLTATWYGAHYYFEDFSTSYISSLEEQIAKIQDLERNLENLQDK